MAISAAEQLLIEFINRARLDPLAEAARYGLGDLNQGVRTAPVNDTGSGGEPANTITALPKQVLAPNDALERAAEGHSAYMLEADVFTHTGRGGSSSRERMEDAGYTLVAPWGTGENLAVAGSTGEINLNAAIAQHHEALFLSDSHRPNILKDAYREIGVSQQEGRFQNGNTTFNASMLTENFGYTGTDTFLTGVAYADRDRDDFYSIGEGAAGTVFSVGDASAGTAGAGGYGLALQTRGEEIVTIRQGAAEMRVRVDFSDGNVKLDLINGARVAASSDLELISGVRQGQLLGSADLSLVGTDGADILIGNSGDNVIWGGQGADAITGGAGFDVASYTGFSGHLSSGAQTVDLLFQDEQYRLGSGRHLRRRRRHHRLAVARPAARRQRRQPARRRRQRRFHRGPRRRRHDPRRRLERLLVGGLGADALIGGDGVDQAWYLYARTPLLVDLPVPGNNSGEAAGDTYFGIEAVAGVASATTCAATTRPTC